MPQGMHASQHILTRLLSRTPSREIWRDVARKASGVKIPWGRMAVFTLALVCVAAARMEGVIHTGVSERGPAINQTFHKIRNYVSIKEMWLLHVFFQPFSRDSLSSLSIRP